MFQFKHKIIATTALLLILIICGCSAWLYYDYKKVESSAPDNQIVKYELQTHEVFSDYPDNSKYHITSPEELNRFYEKYSDVLAINIEYFKHNDIFIQVQSESSGSINHKLESVNLNNNTVNFTISTDRPEIGTDDMVFWYFVAIIPRNQIANLNLSDWSTI